MATTISHKREPLADLVVLNVPERVATIAGNSLEEGLAIDQGRGPAYPRRLP